jgi:hypothetical protein
MVITSQLNLQEAPLTPAIIKSPSLEDAGSKQYVISSLGLLFDVTE